MADTATIDPPVAPAPSAPPAPTNPESKQTINVVPPPVEPGPPPKPGSARARMHDELRKRAGTGDEPAPQPPAPPAAKPSPAGTPPVPPAAGSTEPDGTSKPTETPPSGSTPVDDKGKKVSPWKLVDQYKAQNADLQKQLAEKSQLPEQERKKYLDQIEQVQKRNTELEDHIRFVNYRKSSEFKTKYQEPYDKAWSAAMGELKEIPVYDEGGNPREMRPEDILNLVNLPLPQARELAKQQFGEFADDVMAHRKTIRQLWEAQAAALSDAEKNGAQREKEQGEMTQKRMAEVRQLVTDQWNAANEAATSDPKHGKYFKPADGDEEGNKRLERGYALVDQAFKENPMDPAFTPEQRAAVIKRHAAIRNRAAAYGRLVHMVEQRDARITELEKKVSDYESSAPPAGGRTSEPGAPAAPSSARERIHQALRERASG